MTRPNSTRTAMPTRPPSVLIVHPSPLLRAGIRAIAAASGATIAGEADNAARALAALDRARRPVIAMIAVHLPGLNGFFVAHAMRRFKRSVVAGAMLLGDPSDDEGDMLFGTLICGGAAYAADAVDPPDLMTVVQRIARGEAPIIDQIMARPQIAAAVIAAVRPAIVTIDAAAHSPLTPQERRVLALMAQGRTNRQIAERLGVSAQTIKNYVSSILRKLNAHDRTRAAVIAMQRQWVTPNPPPNDGDPPHPP